VFGIVSDFTVLFKFKTKHWLIMTTIIFVSFQPNNNVTLCLTPDGNYTIQVSTTDVNYTIQVSTTDVNYTIQVSTTDVNYTIQMSTTDVNYTIQVSTTDVNYTRLFKNGSISTG
jgi:hypothetical protein